MRQHLSLIILVLLAQSDVLAEGKSGKSGGKDGVYFETTFFPQVVNKNDTSSFTDSPGAAAETGSGFNTKTTLGVVLGGSWFIGATYNFDTLSTKRSNRVGGDSGLKESTENTQTGVTLGWVGSGWRVLVTSFLSGEKTVDTKNFDATGITGNKEITNKEASGMQMLVGYSYPITSSFSLGPTLAYRNLSYAKQSKINRLNASENYTNKSLFSDATETNFDMMFSMIFRF